MEFQMLNGVPAEDVRELLSVARRRTFRREEVVFHQGDPADSLHLIVNGHFAVRILTPLGQSVMLAVHGPGDAFGALALLSEDASRSATVSALEPAETFAVVRREFFRVCHRHPGVKDVLLALLAEQIRRANERIVVAHHVDADTRVRWALLQLVRAYQTTGDATTVPLTQEQLAEIAGTTRPTVNRVLREEMGRGTVSLQRGRVQVLHAAGLEQRVRGIPRI